MANDYYPALQQDNVDVVTAGIEAITPRGVLGADGVEREVDVIVLCTGFRAADDVAPFPVTGIGGVDLAESWRDGAEAYLGTTVSGFPNMYLLVGPNTGLGHTSMVFIIESQINYVMSCLRTLNRRKLRYMDVRPDVQSRFNQDLQSRMEGTIWASGCTSWYQARDGKITTLWPGFTVEYRARTLRANPKDYACVAV
jgi:cation diffusion facilitator CzcD-associated flavoprotein CzcO